jgi:hypothetical protein
MYATVTYIVVVYLLLQSLMAEVVRSTSEWHRRMTSENLSQSGQAVELGKYVIGHKAYFYRPPSMNETITRGRRAKHIDHYVGPGIIIKHIGTRSIVIRYKEKHFQRDAGMILLEKPRMEAEDPTIADRLIIGPQAAGDAVKAADNAAEASQPLQEGDS